MNHKEEFTPTLPLNLFVKDRPCAVIGGGKVALRKVERLLKGGARIRVIAPEIISGVEDLSRDGRIEILRREFREDDLAGAFLVFAATNIPEVNRQVLQLCRAKGILSCAVDENWPDGDFITPAAFSEGELTVAVSTGGRACRRSRLVKDAIARQITALAPADFLLIGTDHNYLSVEQREPFHLAEKRLDDMGAMIRHVRGVHEFMILNTCNRVELWALASTDEETTTVLRRLLGFDRLGPEGCYVKKGEEAFRHFAAVAAGLVSQTPGEYHIVAQLKEALDKAKSDGWAQKIMQDCLDGILHLSKHIRQETSPFLTNLEIEDLCMRYLQAETQLKHRKIMILGSGVVGEGMVRRLTDQGHSLRWCYRTNAPKIEESRRSLVDVCTFNELRELLSEVNLIVCATGSSGHVLHHGHAPFFEQSHDVLIVDLSVPRNVSPELDGITENVHVVDLDDLKYWHRREYVDMAKIFEISRRIVDEHMGLYQKIVAGINGGDARE